MSEYENEYEEAKAIIDQLIGFFQFSYPNESYKAEQGIKALVKLRKIVKRNMK